MSESKSDAFPFGDKAIKMTCTNYLIMTNTLLLPPFHFLISTSHHNYYHRVYMCYRLTNLIVLYYFICYLLRLISYVVCADLHHVNILLLLFYKECFMCYRLTCDYFLLRNSQASTSASVLFPFQIFKTL